MNYIIRKANINDSNKLDYLLTKLIVDEKQYDKNIDENFIVRNYYKNIVNNPNGCILVAEVDNQIIGYLYGYIMNNITNINLVAKIDSLFIEDSYRNLKIGFNLINEFKKWAKNNNVKYLEIQVCCHNDKAKNLYKKHGFTDIKNIMTQEL